MRKIKKPPQKAASAKKKTSTRGQATRRKITAAARKVFTRHPYHAASIRMVGTEGGFDFTNIHHHFTKAELFEAVAKELYEELNTAFFEWLEGVERLDPKEALDLYLDRSLKYLFSNPDVMESLIQNMGHVKNNPNLPGFDFFTQTSKEIEEAFIEKVPILPWTEELSMWCYTLISLQVSYVGAAAYHAKALGMDPDAKEYRGWVKKTLFTLFLSPIESIIRQALEKRPE